MTELLQLCDVVRDDTLPELGVRLEDHEGNRAENVTVLSSKTKISMKRILTLSVTDSFSRSSLQYFVPG